jgi:hypothetical protein
VNAMGKPSMMMKMNSPSINMPTCGSVMLEPPRDPGYGRSPVSAA